ncbi:MAG: hypothetical protein HQ517_00255 [SAR324 cluster bacterium]|nr:hypothetical protein [SAR324 cluster bacterium]
MIGESVRAVIKCWVLKQPGTLDKPNSLDCAKPELESRAFMIWLILQCAGTLSSSTSSLLDNPSHRGQTSIDHLKEWYPNATFIHTPIHASWHNQVEFYFSV